MKPKTCHNCYIYGYTAEQCTQGKRCRKCGSRDHIAKDYEVSKETITTCGYYREEGHTSKDCEIRRTEEREERINYRKNKQIRIKTVWQQRSEFAEKKHKVANDNNSETTEGTSPTTATEVSTLTKATSTNTLEVIRRELLEYQTKW